MSLLFGTVQRDDGKIMTRSDYAEKYESTENAHLPCSESTSRKGFIIGVVMSTYYYMKVSIVGAVD